MKVRDLKLKNSIINKNLVLEELCPSHASRLFDVLKDERIYTFIPDEVPTSKDVLKEKYKIYLKGSLKKEEIWLNYAIYLPYEDEYIGTLQATVFLETNTIDIAYILDPKKWGKGYAKFSLSLMLNILKARFVNFKCNAYIDTRNIRSIKLVESLNFKRIKYIENADNFKGSRSHEYLYTKDLE